MCMLTLFAYTAVINKEQLSTAAYELKQTNNYLHHMPDNSINVGIVFTDLFGLNGNSVDNLYLDIDTHIQKFPPIFQVSNTITVSLMMEELSTLALMQ